MKMKSLMRFVSTSLLERHEHIKYNIISIIVLDMFIYWL